MIGDATGSRFDPVSLTIKAGDAVRFTVVSAPPHNVAFWSDSIPAAGTSALQANMPQTMAPLNGPLLATAGETYVVSFTGVTPGTYHYYCVPHLAAGMKGTIVVQ
jgi:plastocyanin